MSLSNIYAFFPRALYQYCPIPAVEHPKLSAELFCDIYYLRNLCDTAKFPEWPIQDPLNLLREVLTAWRAEVRPSVIAVEKDFCH